MACQNPEVFFFNPKSYSIISAFALLISSPQPPFPPPPPIVPHKNTSIKSISNTQTNNAYKYINTES